MSESEVFLSIARLAERLSQRFGETLAPFQLTVSQYSVLQALRDAGEEGLACGEIARRLLTRDPDITRLVDRLEVRGLVSRRRARPDRRLVWTEITQEGLQLLEALDAPIGRLHARHLAPIGRRNVRMLTTLLEATEDA
jgi:DNA-binding MarR family transcriptional regulator